MSVQGPPSAQALSCRGAAHSPPRITTFLRVSSVMYGFIRLKATGKSLGAETGSVSGFPGVSFPCRVASESPAPPPPPLMHMRNWFTHLSQQLNSSESQGSLPQVPRETVGSNSGQCTRCRCLNAAPLKAPEASPDTPKATQTRGIPTVRFLGSPSQTAPSRPEATSANS